MPAITYNHLVMLVLFIVLFGDKAKGAQSVEPQLPPQESVAEKPQLQSSVDVNPSYLLGPGDAVTAWVAGGDEFSGKQFVISPSGFVDFPLAGRLLAGGKTVEALKAELVTKLKMYINDPQVSLTIVEFKSQPVSVLGSVKQSGMHQLQGGKSLLEAISMAGGPTPDASGWVVVTRRAQWGEIPVPGATKDPSGNFYVAKISLKDVVEARSPQNNIQVFPHDVIEIPRARLIYVVGQVAKPGGFVLNDNENISALQALSMAGGATAYAALKNARILRPVQGAQDRQQIAVDLSRVIHGKVNDSALKADDILYVPGNMAKNVGVKAIEQAIQLGTGLIIWR